MITTERLELRKFDSKDRKEVTSLLKDKDFMAYSPTGAMSEKQAEDRFEELVSAFQYRDIGKFCVVERTTGQLIGYCGLESFDYKGETVVELDIALGFQLEAKDMRSKRALPFYLGQVKLVI